MADYCASPDTLTLTLGATTLDLMSDQQGFRVSELVMDLPEVRDDTDLAPDRHGALDFTRLYGARAVTVSGWLVPSPAGSRQKTLRLLAPFLNPAARSTLTYRVDGDAVTKTFTVRASDLSVPFNNPTVSQCSLGFKCPDPLAYDANVQTAIAWISAAGGGRVYNLTFNRTYPAGGTSSTQTTNNGDYTVYPLLRLYGPISGPSIQWRTNVAGTATVFNFLSSLTVAAGNWLEIDCRRRTVLLNGDPTNSAYGQVDFATLTQWPYIPAAGWTTWWLYGSNTSNSTQLQVQWQDAYLL